MAGECCSTFLLIPPGSLSSECVRVVFLVVVLTGYGPGVVLAEKVLVKVLTGEGLGVVLAE